MKIPNVCCMVFFCFFFFFTQLLSGLVMDGIVAKEAEKTVSSWTRDQEI